MRPSATQVVALATVVCASWPVAVRGQPFEAVGSRALGMGGAFVAVADDATAIYWNPAGTATGALGSLVIDGQAHESPGTDDDPHEPVVRGSGTLVAFTTPVIGAGYYRLREDRLAPATVVTPSAGTTAGGRPGTSLETQHYVVSLAQTLVEGLHVGVALKAVRGSGAERVAPVGTHPDEALDALEASRGPSRTEFDLDVGVMAAVGRLRLGLAGRNLLEPSFPVALAGAAIGLSRQVRAGAAWFPRDRWCAAMDADLTVTPTVTGRQRALAAGAEVLAADRRFGIRGGLRIQTVDAARPAGSLGATLRVWKGLSLDGHATLGTDDRGWGAGARFTY